MKSAVTNQIAQKSLRLSPRSQIEYTNGQRTSAIGADCNYIDWCFPGLVEVVVQPLTIAVGFALLIINLGPSALVVRYHIKQVIHLQVADARLCIIVFRASAFSPWHLQSWQSCTAT